MDAAKLEPHQTPAAHTASKQRMSPEHKAHNRADQGLNTRTFMIAIIAAILIIIAGLFFFVAGRGTRSIPKANRPQPNSELRLPPIRTGNAA